MWIMAKFNIEITWLITPLRRFVMKTLVISTSIMVHLYFSYTWDLQPQSPSPATVDDVQFCTIANSIDDFHQLKQCSVHCCRFFFSTVSEELLISSNLHFSVIIYSHIGVKHVNKNVLAV